MKVASWNVNSLKIRLSQVIDWLNENQPDVLCLQEIKMQDENFPSQLIEESGYHAVYAGQKTYNGVAILSKHEGMDFLKAIPNSDDQQKRIIAGTYGDTRIICIYVPNGENLGSDKYKYKLEWLKTFTIWLQQEMRVFPRLMVLGDFNIAPDDRDVYDPELWKGKVLCSDTERRAFNGLLDLGLTDSFRLFEQAEKQYSWWDYRMMAFRRNRGLRIDHILLSQPLAELCEASYIDKSTRKLDRPSDHAPVIVHLS